jgi:cell division septum initiation protein DivIVA
MLSFEEALDETVTPTLVEDGHARVDDVDTEPTEPITVQESPTSAAARMLELAALTADRLVADAETEAESVVTTARARADAILAASRTEAHQVAAELARRRDEQTAELDRERATALAGLADEKAALQARIATLRQMQSDYRSQMRHYLTEQLSLLDATLIEPPAAVAG